MLHCTLVITNPHGARLVLERGGTCWALPSTHLGGEWIAAEVAQLQAHVRALAGADCLVVREITGAGMLAAEVELLGETSGELVAVDQARESVSSDDRRVIDVWRATANDDRRAPWQRRGWIAGAQAWMDQTLHAVGLSRCGTLRQLKGAWSESAVLSAATPEGDVYLKAVSSDSAEPLVVEALAARHADLAPRIIAIHTPNHWMLMHASPGSTPAPARWPEVLERLAELQAAERPHVNDWLARGVTDRRAHSLREKLSRILVDVPRQLAVAGILSHDETRALSSMLHASDDALTRLEELGIAPSLVHDDFGPYNVLDDGTNMVFIDWSDTAVAHPFFSAHHFIGDSVADSTMLVDAYLAPWISEVGHAAAREAFALTARLYPIYRAVFNDVIDDYAAWAMTNPTAGEVAFARSVFLSILAVNGDSALRA